MGSPQILQGALDERAKKVQPHLQYFIFVFTSEALWQIVYTAIRVKFPVIAHGEGLAQHGRGHAQAAQERVKQFGRVEGFVPRAFVVLRHDLNLIYVGLGVGLADFDLGDFDFLFFHIR